MHRRLLQTSYRRASKDIQCAHSRAYLSSVQARKEQDRASHGQDFLHNEHAFTPSTSASTYVPPSQLLRSMHDEIKNRLSGSSPDMAPQQDLNASDAPSSILASLKTLADIQLAINEQLFSSKAAEKAPIPVDINVPLASLDEWKTLILSFLENDQTKTNKEEVDHALKVLETAFILDPTKVTHLTESVYQKLLDLVKSDIISFNHAVVLAEYFAKHMQTKYDSQITKSSLTSSTTSTITTATSVIEIAKIKHQHISFLFSGPSIENFQKRLLSALNHLRQLENPHTTGVKSNRQHIALSVPLPETYTLIVSNLIQMSRLNSSYLPMAWDMYARSRLVSHPVPDVSLYNVMLYACGGGQYPAPERAKELFADMQANNVAPNAETYTNLIVSLCRTRSKLLRDYRSRVLNLAPSNSAIPEREKEQQDNLQRAQYLEALDFMRQMVENNLNPSVRTLEAILIGCQVQNDLGRARWIWARWIQLLAENNAHEELLGHRNPSKLDYESSSLLARVINVYKDFKPKSNKLWPQVTGPLPQTKLETITELNHLVLNHLPDDYRSPLEKLLTRALQTETDQLAIYIKEHKIKVQQQSTNWIHSEKNDTAADVDNNNSISSTSNEHTDSSNNNDINTNDINSNNDTDNEKHISSYPNGSPVIIKINEKFMLALLNFYARKASFTTFAIIFDGMFQVFGKASKYTRSPSYYEIAMNAASKSLGVEHKKKRDVIVPFAENVFKQWKEVEKSLSSSSSLSSSLELSSPTAPPSSNTYMLSSSASSRIENMWTSMVRIYATHGFFQEAINLLSEFVKLYPPTLPVSDQQSNTAAVDQINPKNRLLKSPIQFSSVLYPETMHLTNKATSDTKNCPTLSMRNVGELYRALLVGGLTQEALMVKNIVSLYQPNKNKTI